MRKFTNLMGGCIILFLFSPVKGIAGSLFNLKIPTGYSLVFDEHSLDKSYKILEFLPEGEHTATWENDWRNMFSVLLYNREKIKVNAVQFLKAALTQQSQSCERKIAAGNINQYLENGYPMVMLFVSCGKLYGKNYGEVTFFKIIETQETLYQIHVSKRLDPFGTQEQPVEKAILHKWREQLDANFLCDETVKTCVLLDRTSQGPAD